MMHFLTVLLHLRTEHMAEFFLGREVGLEAALGPVVKVRRLMELLLADLE